VFSTNDVTLAIDNSGLLVYSQASAIDEHPCANRTESINGIPSTQQVAAWFHQHGLNRLVLSMGGDGVYYSDINGESGWSAPIKTNVINVTGAGDAMMAGLASCWVDGMPFIDSVRFAQADALFIYRQHKGNCQQYHHPHNTSHYIHNDFPFMPVNPASAPGFGMFDEYGRRLSAHQKLTHETLIFFGNCLCVVGK
jgi:hypothetical protein